MLLPKAKHGSFGAMHRLRNRSSGRVLCQPIATISDADGLGTSTVVSDLSAGASLARSRELDRGSRAPVPPKGWLILTTCRKSRKRASSELTRNGGAREHPSKWHNREGRPEGVHPLVSRNRRAGPSGRGVRALQPLGCANRNDWIERHCTAQGDRVAGAEVRVAHGLDPQQQPGQVWHRFPDFDLLVSWKPPHAPPTRREPALDDGVRRFRPELAWGTDTGREPGASRARETGLWFNTSPGRARDGMRPYHLRCTWGANWDGCTKLGMQGQWGATQ